jgi:hypothetical protein
MLIAQVSLLYRVHRRNVYINSCLLLIFLFTSPHNKKQQQPGECRIKKRGGGMKIFI